MKCQMSREALVLRFFVAVVFVWGVCGGESSEPERRALLELKGGVLDPDGVLSAWNGSDLRLHHCSWPGVTCDSAARVVALRIVGGGRGNRSEALSCSLSCGSRNVGSGGGVGLLRGEISPWVGKLGRLRVLSLPYNGLVGEIPAEIWGLEGLEVLDLEGNSLSGRLPGRFRGLRRLRVLNLGFNGLRGEIPVGLSKCQDLKVLNLAGNELSGLIPRFLGWFSKLNGLYLSRNKLVGDVPAEIGAGCESLEHLDLSGNSLAGEIPGSLGNCRQLRRLLLSSNALSGVIPHELSELQLLEVLDVSGNRLTGPIPAELGRCVSLSVIVLSSGDSSLELNGGVRNDGNRFEGSVPEEITALPGLKIVWAPSSGLKGKVPRNWGSCENLEMVNLGRNAFEGEVLGVFEKCKKLHYLDLSSNKLTGKLDGNLRVPCMTVFNVSGNLLSGPIPRFKDMVCSKMALSSEQVSSLPYKSYFTCKARQETNLPLLDHTNLAVIHDLSGNSFSGPISSLPVPPKSFGNKMVYAFLAGGNKLAGPFPETIFRKCDGLDGMILNVSNNVLSGQIPREIATMCRSLMMLDASGNQISGLIPETLGDLTSLVVLDLSRNNLDADVPLVPFLRRDRILTSLAVQSKDQDDLSLSAQNDTDYQSGNGGLNSIEIASVASASAIVMVLLALIILFFFTRKWVPDSRVQGLEPREITVFSHVGAQLTFEGIVRSTGNFNNSNCIGNGGFGSTFKSEIQPGVIVAVKRLSVGRFQQGIQQFHAEVKTLGRVRHPNLVTLLGYHASETEMFLIYNYLPGGNLEKFIKERSSRATDWKILHKIALDIANALAYLHDQCVPRVLHRDVKPSNILLDNDLKAYLSDFGLSRLLGTSETHATTGVAGTFGYLAPEYAMTCRVSDKSDVYSYGVVLLELISDKRPLDPSFSSHGDGFNIVSWASMLLKQGRGKDVFTAGLWESGPHDDLVEMLHLAVTCTNETLSIRPTMKHVVQRLKRIKPLSLGSS